MPTNSARSWWKEFRQRSPTNLSLDEASGYFVASQPGPKTVGRPSRWGHVNELFPTRAHGMFGLSSAIETLKLPGLRVPRLHSPGDGTHQRTGPPRKAGLVVQ